MNQLRNKGPASKIDGLKIWSLNYRLMTSVVADVSPAIAELGLEAKELFLLSEVDEHPHPAELATCFTMPKPTVTVYVKRLEAAGFLKREIDATDLRRHRLLVTPAGRKTIARGLALLSEAFDARLASLDPDERATLQALLEKMA